MCFLMDLMGIGIVLNGFDVGWIEVIIRRM